MTVAFNPSAAWAYLLQRLTERTTWVGFIGLFTAAGIAITPTETDKIAAAGTAFASLVLMFTTDKKATTTATVTPVIAITKAP